MRTQHTESLPLGWRIVRLGDVAEHCLGKMLDAKKNKGTPFPYLRNPNVRWFKIDLSDLQEMPFEEHELDRYGLLDGDVVVCEGGEAGRAAIWSSIIPNVKFQKAIHRVRVGPELLNRYLVYKLMADHQSGRLMDYFTGATIKHLTGQDLDRYEFPLPPLPEQRRIADVLDRAEALRAKRRAALAELDGLDVSIFRNMFTNPGSETLSVAPISALAADSPNSIRTGPFGSQLLHSEFQNEGIAVLGIDNIVHNYFEQGKIRRISQRKYQELKRYTVHSGDVLISIMGTCGRCAIAPRHIELSINTKHLCCITLDRGKCIPEYLRACFLWHPQVQYLLGVRERGAVMPGLNMQLIKELQIPVPPLALQQEFARRVAAVERLKAVQRASLAELDALFASLQDRAFRGAL